VTTCLKILKIAMVVFLAGIIVCKVGLAEAAKGSIGEKGKQKSDGGSKERLNGSSGKGTIAEGKPAGQNKNAKPIQHAKTVRNISDRVIFDNSDSLAARSHPSIIPLAPELRVVDNIAISGFKMPPTAPVISVTSSPILQVSNDQGAEIAFHSTTSGTYSIAIRNDGAKVVRTLEGSLELGANSMLWDGKNDQGAMAPSGDYSYYITAAGSGGTRSPPPGGDGAIVVIGTAPPSYPGPIALDSGYLLTLPIIAAAGAAIFLFLRRRATLRLYLPIEASEVIDDIRVRYPGANVEDYVERAEEGLRRYRGVTIRNAEPDDRWLVEFAGKVKEIAGIDSVSVNYGGKTHLI
jgi:hypothetical protein